MPTTQEWLQLLEDPASHRHPAIQTIYGNNADHVRERLALIQRACAEFHSRFGNTEIRIHRAPGRINLRGMHVDTHGGYIAPMTLGRETIIVSNDRRPRRQLAGTSSLPYFPSLPSKAPHQFHNLDPTSPPIQLDPNNLPATHTGWQRYIAGCTRAVHDRFPDVPLTALNAVVASDIPIGAGLSSSASLCAATILAILAANELSLSPAALVETIRDAEWHAGARCGLGDPAAIVYGARDQLTLMAFDNSGTPAHLEYIAWPADLDVIVADSGQRRNIAGAQRIAYSANRAAYSCALAVLRAEISRSLGRETAMFTNLRDCAEKSPFERGSQMEARGEKSPCERGSQMEARGEKSPCERGSQMEARGEKSPFEGGFRGMFPGIHDLLAAIPEEISLIDLEHLIGAPAFNAAFESQLGDIDRAAWPTTCALRGPLTYGIAESQRAQVFAEAIAQSNYTQAGALMSIGHAGDRTTPIQSPFRPSRPYSPPKPLHEIPGAYAASTPLLDTLVDTALAAGAHGASLTGAGLGGSILALANPQTTPHIIAALNTHLDPSDIWINHPAAPASELPFPSI